jgi:hypothetical protein
VTLDTDAEVAGYVLAVKLRQKPDTFKRQASWRAVSMLTGLAAAALTRKALTVIWTKAGSTDDGAPILDPADRRFSWKDALLWVVTVGVGVSIARLVSARLAVAGWEVATGTLPPGVEEPVEV